MGDLNTFSVLINIRTIIRRSHCMCNQQPIDGIIDLFKFVAYLWSAGLIHSFVKMFFNSLILLSIVVLKSIEENKRAKQ